MKLAQAHGWRQVVALLALLFFAFQGYLTQTHIHAMWRNPPGAHMAEAGAQSTLPRGLPPSDNPAACPICQDMAQAGHFTFPGIAAFAMPLRIAPEITVAFAIPFVAVAISHIWLGRAPPGA